MPLYAAHDLTERHFAEEVWFLFLSPVRSLKGSSLYPTKREAPPAGTKCRQVTLLHEQPNRKPQDLRDSRGKNFGERCLRADQKQKVRLVTVLLAKPHTPVPAQVRAAVKKLQRTRPLRQRVFDKASPAARSHVTSLLKDAHHYPHANARKPRQRVEIRRWRYVEVWHLPSRLLAQKLSAPSQPLDSPQRVLAYADRESQT